MYGACLNRMMWYMWVTRYPCWIPSWRSEKWTIYFRRGTRSQMSFSVFVSFTLSMISFFSAYLLIPSEYMPAFCIGENGKLLNLSWSCVGASISHSMKYPYLSNVLSDFTHLIGSRLISSSPVLVEAQPPTHRASFDAWLHYTGYSHRDSRFFPCSQLLNPCCQYLHSMSFHDLSDTTSKVLQ